MDRTLFPNQGAAIMRILSCLLGMLLFRLSFLGLLSAAGALAFGVNLLPDACFLKMDAQGFVVRSWFRQKAYRWSDVAAFKVLTRRWLGLIPVSRQVVFSFSESYGKRNIAMRAVGALARFDAALPCNYGMKAQQLAGLLEAARRIAAAKSANQAA